MKKEIKTFRERLKKANKTETERRRKEDAMELEMQEDETKKRKEEDARREAADRALAGVFEKERKRLEKIEREQREEEEEMLGFLRERIERLEKNDEDIAAYAKDALVVARQAVKDLESELETQKSAVMKRRKQCAKEARKRVKEMQRNREAEENRVNKALKGGKGANDEDNQELEKKRFEYKLRMDTEQHEKMLMDEARLQLIEDADIKRVEVTLNEALVAVEKVKDEEGERRDFVQKELLVLLDEFAIKDYEVQSRRENFDATLSSECEAVSIIAKKEEVQIRTEEEARRVEFTKSLRSQRKNEEERRVKWDRDHFADVQKLEEMKSNEASTRRSENTRRSAFATSFAQKDANAAAIFLALYLESLEKSDLSREEDMADVMEADGALYVAAENLRKRRESEEYKRDFETRKAVEKSEYFAELERVKKVQEVKAVEAREKAKEREKLRDERIAAAKAQRAQFLEMSKKRAEEQKEKMRVLSELREKRRAEAEEKRLKELEDERVRMEKRMQEEREAVNGKKEAAAAAAAAAAATAPKPIATTTASAAVTSKKEETAVNKSTSGFVAANPSAPIRASGSIAKMKTDALWNENYKKFLKFVDQSSSSSSSSSSSTMTIPKQEEEVERPKKKEEKVVAEKKPVVAAAAAAKEVPQSILDSRDAVAIAQHLVDSKYDAKTVANAVSTLYTNGGRRGSDLAEEIFMTLPKSISGAALVNIQDNAVACKLLENCEPGRQTVELSEPSTSEPSSEPRKQFFLAYSSRKAMYAGVEILEVATSVNESRAVEIYSNISRVPRASIVKRAVLQQGSRPGTESKNPESKPPSKIIWIAKLLAKISPPSTAVQTLETFRGGKRKGDEKMNAYVKDIVQIIRKNEGGDIEGAQAFAKILESRLLL